MQDDCYRPMSYTSVSIYKKMFVFTINEGIPLQCPEAYLFVFRKNLKVPMIFKYPKIDVKLSEIEGTVSEHKVKKYCETNQNAQKEELLPFFQTRSKFINVVRNMISAFREIRDFGCTEDADGFVVQVSGRAYGNADLEAVISYLYNVAYQHGFCI
ncbi:unnamed protein product [Agarophyton chilense]